MPEFLKDEMGLDAQHGRGVPAPSRPRCAACTSSTIRSGGGLWSDESNPWELDLIARCRPGAQCPESFTLTAGGAAALAEYLSDRLLDFVAYADEELSRELHGREPDDHDLDLDVAQRRRAALESLAYRFGIEIAARPSPDARPQGAGVSRSRQ